MTMYEQIDSLLRDLRSSVLKMNYDYATHSSIQHIVEKYLDCTLDSFSHAQKMRFVPPLRIASAKSMQTIHYMIDILIDDFFQLSLIKVTVFESLKRSNSEILKILYSILKK